MAYDEIYLDEESGDTVSIKYYKNPNKSVSTIVFKDSEDQLHRGTGKTPAFIYINEKQVITLKNHYVHGIFMKSRKS